MLLHGRRATCARGQGIDTSGQRERGMGYVCAASVAAVPAHCGQASRVNHSCIRCCQAAVVDHRHQQAPKSHLLLACLLFSGKGERCVGVERQREGRVWRRERNSQCQLIAEGSLLRGRASFLLAPKPQINRSHSHKTPQVHPVSVWCFLCLSQHVNPSLALGAFWAQPKGRFFLSSPKQGLYSP